MKKIVALVLCLALALSLCTVSFAATLIEGNDQGTELSGTWTLTKRTGEDDYDAYGVRYKLERKVVGSQNAIYWDVVETDKTNADYTVVDDTDLIYVREKVAYNHTATVVNTVDLEKVAKCGDVFTYNDVAVYKTEAGKYGISDGAVAGTLGEDYDIVLVGGKTIDITLIEPTYVTMEWVEENAADVAADDGTTCGNTFYVVAHTPEIETDTNKTTDVVSVKSVVCDVCGDKLAFTTTATKANTTFGYGKWINVVDIEVEGDEIEWDDWTTTDGGKDLYIKHVIGTTAASTGSAGSSSETVESAKTFDAGIALYAGMALASVAGSAVVIGKKKEF